jgi:hypothetical protein
MAIITKEPSPSAMAYTVLIVTEKKFKSYHRITGSVKLAVVRLCCQPSAHCGDSQEQVESRPVPTKRSQDINVV